MLPGRHHNSITVMVNLGSLPWLWMQKQIKKQIIARIYGCLEWCIDFHQDLSMPFSQAETWRNLPSLPWSHINTLSNMLEKILPLFCDETSQAMVTPDVAAQINQPQTAVCHRGKELFFLKKNEVFYPSFLSKIDHKLTLKKTNKKILSNIIKMNKCNKTKVHPSCNQHQFTP